MKMTICLLLLSLLMPLTASAQIVQIPNSSFEQGTSQSPSGWTLSAGNGGAAETQPYDGNRSLWIQNESGKIGASWWQSTPLSLTPGKPYILYFQARRDNLFPGGCAVSGTNSFNVDLNNLDEKWQSFRHVLVTPNNGAPPQLRFGQWESQDRFSFDKVSLVPAIAVHRRIGNVQLGFGERIIGDRYNFAPPMAENRTILFRPLKYFDCHFNTNRCIFNNDTRLEFEHSIAEHPVRSARIYMWTQHADNGTLSVQVSKNRGRWISLGEVREGQKQLVSLPDSLFPLASLGVRIMAKTAGTITMSGYRLEAMLDGAPVNAAGETRYVEIERAQPGLDIALDAPGLFDPSQAIKGVTLKLKSGNKELAGDLRLLANGVEFSAGKLGQALDCPAHSGKHNLVLESKAATLKTAIEISEYFNTTYGELLDASGIWWASSGWKIPKSRELPQSRGKALHIDVARNEAEAAQLVIRPDQPISDFRIIASELKSETGAVLPKDQIQILRVAYVPVTLPTDNTGVAALWPDPLPPTSVAMTLTAGENQPFWVRVKTRANTAPGLYKGRLQLSGKEYLKSVPITVRVYNFTLPDRMTCTSALGFGVDRAFEYHGAKSETDKRKVLDLYLQALADYHITPYNAVPLDPFKVTWPNVKPGDNPLLSALNVQIDWSRWDQAMQSAYDNYHLTSFNLPMEGMGGGTFYSRTEPSILGFGEESPVYQTLFKNYCVAVEQHLRAKGWLEDAYVYWFDEPDPKDYAFVMKGFNRIKTAAPGIPRMLTEEIQKELIGGPNIWCPISPELKPEETRERQRHGEKIWWYVCTGPKAPYATLFIDHPATELRVWLWQTWQRNVEGILIWETLLWTSPTAYPDPTAPQNPYEDPMGWEYGYGGEPGMHRPWGNGDGRFLYPPLAAANGRPAAPVFDPPVDCIRIEMLRDGLEDYEYLAMLRKALAVKGATLTPAKRQALEKLLEVPSDITETMTQFTRDPAPIEARRRQIAEALEAL